MSCLISLRASYRRHDERLRQVEGRRYDAALGRGRVEEVGPSLERAFRAASRTEYGFLLLDGKPLYIDAFRIRLIPRHHHHAPLGQHTLPCKEADVAIFDITRRHMPAMPAHFFSVITGQLLATPRRDAATERVSRCLMPILRAARHATPARGGSPMISRQA